MQSDDILVRLARRAAWGNDPASLDALVRELRPLVVRTVRLIVGSGSWPAEDAAQEALLDVVRGLPTLRSADAVRGWALRVATARALKVAQRERLLALRRRALAEADLVPAMESSRTAALKEAFDRLPPRLRATAVLRLYAGLSERETAEALGCSVGTVKSNLHDARKRLAVSLGEAGHAPVVRLRRVEEAC